MNPFPNFLPPVGGASTATDLAPLLGRVYQASDGKQYRLVKAAAAIAAAAKKIVSTGLTSTVPNWSVDFPGVSGYSVATPAGLIPVGQVGSTGTTGLVAGDYFLVQVSGVGVASSAGTLAIYDTVGTAGTTGLCDTTTAAPTTIGTALNAATGAATDINVILRGLV